MQYIKNAKLKDTQSKMYEIAQTLEREFTAHGGYSPPDGEASWPSIYDTNNYRYDIELGIDPVTEIETYQITAYPPQVNNRYVLRLNHEGSQTHSANGGVDFMGSWP